MDGDKTNEKRYLCCFCDTFIESSYSDPCAVDILTNITQPKDKQYNQTFSCHMNCFREQLHEKIKYYFYLECLIESEEEEID